MKHWGVSGNVTKEKEVTFGASDVKHIPLEKCASFAHLRKSKFDPK